MKVFIFCITVILSATAVNAENYSPFAAMIHNAAYKLTKDFKQNDALMKRTLTSLSMLRKKMRAPSISRTRKLIVELRNAHRMYHRKIKKLEKYYKRRWNRPRYRGMSREWKKKKIAVHREKLNLLGSLSEDLKKIFNTWTARYNAVKKASKRAEIAAALKKALKPLTASMRKHRKLRKKVFGQLSEEVEILKLMKK